MNGKLIYLATKDEYIFITPMALTNSIKDELQVDMMERLDTPVAVISHCDSFKYIPPRVKTPKDWEDMG
ncbi:hypothetical protein [Lacticaseibacillus paracasei]|uniref:Uncharacterized protein n=1 Tax=Lacticaseibacillus paracasei TaxID=1597 RepID=A0ABD6W369_LACPA|nr:hypothetical protein [Lacticaseibacillus paracasei]MCT3379468.1 hypothetical protein [Lacticaseibacillus paracasei]MCZ2766179.1 hypothetical protein [Lacticaseibacillus paracasei]MCZ2769110.1 hypothetical protein [Lacticaseibacillus paracasei]MCZ2774619.1 hypothetical protein [Lacticaseibacillus paracasei]MCZ2777575.1 hypothetical protein [Lacticaseibacillus paracasei]